MQSKASCSKAVLLKQMNKLMVKTYRKLSVIFSLTDAVYNALKILNVKIVVFWLFLNRCNTINNLLNLFTAKCSQRQISTRFPNFFFSNFEKQMVPCESAGRELLFEWSHHRIWSADSNVRGTLQNSIKYSGSERVKDSLKLFFPGQSFHLR